MDFPVSPRFPPNNLKGEPEQTGREHGELSYKGNGILTHDRKTTKEIPEDFLDILGRLISEMRVLVNGTFQSAFLLIGM